MYGEIATDSLQDVCVGCVGILKQILTRALAWAREKDGVWKEEFLERALLSDAQVASILQEVMEGEASITGAISNAERTRAEARKLLAEDLNPTYRRVRES